MTVWSHHECVWWVPVTHFIPQQHTVDPPFTFCLIKQIYLALADKYQSPSQLIRRMFHPDIPLQAAHKTNFSIYIHHLGPKYTHLHLQDSPHFKLSRVHAFLLILLGSQEPLEDLFKCPPRSLLMLLCAGWHSGDSPVVTVAKPLPQCLIRWHPINGSLQDDNDANVKSIMHGRSLPSSTQLQLGSPRGSWLRRKMGQPASVWIING